MIFVEIFHDFGRFFTIRILFHETDPADQNETDLNGSGSETLFPSLIDNVRSSP